MNIKRYGWLLLIIIIIIGSVVAFLVSSTIEDPMARQLFFVLFLFLLVVAIVVIFSMTFFAIKGRSFTTPHPRWRLGGFGEGYDTTHLYSKHYKNYYDRVQNLDHAREADAMDRERVHSRPEGLVDVRATKTKLLKQRKRTAPSKIKPSETRYKEGISFCPQCEKPYLPEEEKRCSRCGTKF